MSIYSFIAKIFEYVLLQGYFFDNENTTPASVNGQVSGLDMSQEVTSIHAELVSRPKFHKLRTVWVGIILILLFVSVT